MPSALPLADGHIQVGSPNANAGAADDTRLQRSTTGLTFRTLWRFAMLGANTRNVRRSAYCTFRGSSIGDAHIRLIDDHDPAISFNESQFTWNIPKTGENWGSTSTGGGSITGTATTYDATVRSPDVRYEDSLQAQFEEALARGDEFFTLLEHLDDEGTSNNTSIRYGTRLSESSPVDKRTYLLWDLADATPPTVAITSHTNNQKVGTSSITLEGTANDPQGPGEDELVSGVDTVEVRLNGGSWVEATGTETWSIELTLVPGTNTIEVRATDVEGNVSDVLEYTIRLSTVNMVLASSHLGYVTSTFGFTRTVTGNVLVGRVGSATHRGFVQFSAVEIAEIPTDVLALGLRFNLTEKNGVIVDSDELEIVVPLIDEYDVDSASDGDLYGEIGSSSVKMAAVAYDVATGTYTIDLGEVGIEALLTLIDESAPFPIGLRFKNNDNGVNWEFARVSDMQLIVTVAGFPDEDDSSTGKRASSMRPGESRASDSRPGLGR